jgi:N-methylhydantoinase B
VDPILFQVLASALVEATEEMAIALKRSAYSTNIKTRNDFSCAFFDRELRTVAQASGQPVHLGSLSESVPRVIKRYGPENLKPGDGILSNDPYQGSVHLNDISLISPVFFGDELMGYVANLAHHVDVGGGAPGSIGAFREVFQEGVIVPGVKMVTAGKMNDDVFRLVLAQIRSKRETAGDFRAQVAANVTGAKRIAALAERYGTATLNEYIDGLMEYTERRARSDLAKLPHGVFSAEGVVDNDAYTTEPVQLKATVTIDNDGVFFDFAGSDPQRRAPVNSTYAMTFSACAYVLKCLIDPDIPVNAGFYSLVKLNAPYGTVTNVAPPGPVVGGWETQTRLCDVILKALSQVIPERVPAGTKAMMAQVAFGGIDPRDGDMYAYYEALAGGYGARMSKDGPDAVQTHGQNTENAPIEESERGYPIRIGRYELVNDSDGPGKFRGGLGLRRDYVFVDHDASFTILSDRDRWGPHGLFGGKPGKVAQYFLLRGGEQVRLGSKTTLEIRADDAVSFRSCGGGGFGDPFERDPQRVLADVRDGKVSEHRARDEYGVAVDTMRWQVDERETARLRTK